MRSMNRVLLWFFATRLGMRIEMQVLTNLVTDSLALPSMNVLTLPHDKALEAFATLTARYLATCSPSQREALHRKSGRIGERLRAMLTDRSDAAITALVFRLYRNIGIEMEGRLPRQVTVRRCYFSQHYPASTCTVASLMDDGIVSALYGSGRLCFTQRITEGNASCRCQIK